MRDGSWERDAQVKNDELPNDNPHSGERICPECKRKFVISDVGLWVYKLSTKGKTLWYCRWNCVRVGEKKLKGSKIRGMEELKSKKPSKEKLEEHLRAGAHIADIARKYDASPQSVNNWIKSYGLAGIQGVKKPKDEVPVVDIQSDIEIAKDEKFYSDMTQAYIDDAVQASPTLAEIEQFHTDDPVQELPKVEMDSVNIKKTWNQDEWEASIKEKWEGDSESITTEPKSSENPIPKSVNSPDPVPAPPFEEVWQNALEDLAALKRSYVTLAQQEFKDRLLEMVTYLAG